MEKAVFAKVFYTKVLVITDVMLALLVGENIQLILRKQFGNAAKTLVQKQGFAFQSELYMQIRVCHLVDELVSKLKSDLFSMQGPLESFYFCPFHISESKIPIRPMF